MTRRDALKLRRIQKKINRLAEDSYVSFNASESANALLHSDNVEMDSVTELYLRALRANLDLRVAMLDEQIDKLFIEQTEIEMGTK